ncbi:hypothetical protein IWQ54_004655 [Labrenzia sp. EL_195]|nr:hypothetical protein [Labrenzia sp. EL_195]
MQKRTLRHFQRNRFASPALIKPVLSLDDDTESDVEAEKEPVEEYEAGSFNAFEKLGFPSESDGESRRADKSKKITDRPSADKLFLQSDRPCVFDYTPAVAEFDTSFEGELTPYEELLLKSSAQPMITVNTLGLHPWAPKCANKAESAKRFNEKGGITYVIRPFSWLLGCPIIGVVITPAHKAMKMQYTATLNPLALAQDPETTWYPVITGKQYHELTESDVEKLCAKVREEFELGEYDRPKVTAQPPAHLC